MEALTIAAVAFALSLVALLGSVSWWLGSWRVAVVVLVATLLQGAHIAGFFVLDGEVARATLLAIHPVASLAGLGLGATMHYLFYEADVDDLFILDADGEEIGHVHISTKRRQRAKLVGGDELPTRRLWGSTDMAYYCRDPYFREENRDILGVPPENSLPDDEAMLHFRKVHEMHETLERDSDALDVLKISAAGLLKKGYRKGKSHERVAEENVSAATDLSLNAHEWIESVVSEVHERVDDYRNESDGTDTQDLENADKNGSDGDESGSSSHKYMEVDGVQNGDGGEEVTVPEVDSDE